MKVPVVVPALTKIYGEKYLDHFKAHFSSLNIEEAYEQVQKDANAEGVEIKFSSAALYTPLKILGFSFKKRPRGRQANPDAPPKAPKVPKPAGTGKRWRKTSPVFDKFIAGLGGLEETKKYLSELVMEGISIKIAVERINEKIKGNYSYANISYFAKKLNMEFEKGKRSGGNPNLGKNRPSPVLDEFISNFKDEEEAKAYLQSLTHISLTNAVEEINERVKTKINYGTLFSFAKKYGLEFKRDKAKKSEGKNQPLIKGEVEMVSEEPISKKPSKVFYKCSNCGEAKGVQKPHVIFPLGLKGMRCHHCKEWGTYVATIVSEAGTHRFAVVEIEGFSENIKIPSEMEVDANLID
jgi:transposase